MVAVDEPKQGGEENENRVEYEFDLERVINDLALLLIYLTSWREDADGPAPGPPTALMRYDFRVLDGLKKKGYLSDAGRDNVTLTDEGVKEAERLRKKLLASSVGQAYREPESKVEARSKARVDVEFFCEICGSKIGSPSGYELFKQYLQGKIPNERMMKLLRRYHTKHWHTDILKIYRQRFAYDVRKEMGYMQAGEEAKGFAQRMVPQESLESALADEKARYQGHRSVTNEETSTE